MLMEESEDDEDGVTSGVATLPICGTGAFKYPPLVGEPYIIVVPTMPFKLSDFKMLFTFCNVDVKSD